MKIPVLKGCGVFGYPAAVVWRNKKSCFLCKRICRRHLLRLWNDNIKANPSKAFMYNLKKTKQSLIYKTKKKRKVILVTRYNEKTVACGNQLVSSSSVCKSKAGCLHMNNRPQLGCYDAHNSTDLQIQRFKLLKLHRNMKAKSLSYFHLDLQMFTHIHMTLTGM